MLKATDQETSRESIAHTNSLSVKIYQICLLTTAIGDDTNLKKAFAFVNVCGDLLSRIYPYMQALANIIHETFRPKTLMRRYVTSRH